MEDKQIQRPGMMGYALILESNVAPTLYLGWEEMPDGEGYDLSWMPTVTSLYLIPTKEKAQEKVDALLQEEAEREKSENQHRAVVIIREEPLFYALWRWVPKNETTPVEFQLNIVEVQTQAVSTIHGETSITRKVPARLLTEPARRVSTNTRHVVRGDERLESVTYVVETEEDVQEAVFEYPPKYCDREEVSKVDGKFFHETTYSPAEFVERLQQQLKTLTEKEK